MRTQFTRRPPRLLAGASVAAIAATALAGEIPVVNHSFETPDLAVCTFGGWPPGWSAACGSWGAWDAGLGEQCYYNGFPAGVPDGAQNGFVNCPTGPLTQVLSATVQEGETYTLVVSVGRRSDGFPMEAYRIRLKADTIVLAEDNDSLDPPLGGWATSTISFTAPPGHASIGKPLAIELWLLQGPQANFDDVRLYTGPYSPPAATGDLNGDGKVDGGDLGLLLGGWGPCPACPACPMDLNGDCVVDGSDLGLLLGLWNG